MRVFDYLEHISSLFNANLSTLLLFIILCLVAFIALFKRG